MWEKPLGDVTEGVERNPQDHSSIGSRNCPLHIGAERRKAIGHLAPQDRLRVR